VASLGEAFAPAHGWILVWRLGARCALAMSLNAFVSAAEVGQARTRSQVSVAFARMKNGEAFGPAHGIDLGVEAWGPPCTGYARILARSQHCPAAADA
jgi:hypothetical protein